MNNKNKVAQNEEFKYIVDLLAEYGDEDIFLMLKSRLLKNKYGGLHFDKRVTVDDMGIVTTGYAPPETKFEMSLNMIHKAYKNTLSDEELDKLCVKWINSKEGIPAKTLWRKLGYPLREARLWKINGKIPDDKLQEIADKLGVKVEKFKSCSNILDQIRDMLKK